MDIIIQKAVKHILLSCQAEISGKTYEVLTAFYAKQTQSNPVLSAVEWANLETAPGAQCSKSASACSAFIVASLPKITNSYIIKLDIE